MRKVAHGKLLTLIDPAWFFDDVVVETSRLSFALIPLLTSLLFRFVKYDEIFAESNSGNCSFGDHGIDSMELSITT